MFTARDRVGAAAVITASTIVALAGCGSGAPASEATPVELTGASAETNDYVNELYRSAIDSGKTDIVVYGPAPSTDAALFTAFTETFPELSIVPQDAPDSQTFTKLQVEAESGSRIADLYTGGSSSVVQLVRDEPDICTVPDIRTAGDELISYDETALLYYRYTAFTFVYNTDLVSEEEAPKSWEDLLDPKWKGQLLIGDPTVTGGVRHVLTQLLVPETADTWGEEYLEQLAAQDLNIAESEPTVPADIASGRFPVGVGVYSGFYAAQKAKDAPIAAVFPFDNGGTYFGSSGLCTVTDSPNADAALVFLNWLFSEDGQAALQDDPNSYAHLLEYTGDLPLPSSFEHIPDGEDPAVNAEYAPVLDRIFG
ncbi:extracellular solute-binding protein [Microbacterium betulae]|uniref:Extracellular solute-binding protein n=1 Tax=Microbacterium betulae TaxID=2981139 RepID=A0AA97FH84_9MICO|nr:extracellular solute-binding protein [Microbacterium sp. AB]WOF22858.1 extracellular solute-binding protein [Microbacterium sp. AB]